MRKEDLKNGMVVELEDGDRYIVIDDMLTKAGGFLYLQYYDDELRFVSPIREEKFDIVKIFSAVCDLNDIKGGDLTLLWEKPWKPSIGESYYYPNFLEDNMCGCYVWGNDEIDNKLISEGLIFKTKEEAIELAEKMLEVVEEG